jgi:hypothetical protein
VLSFVEREDNCIVALLKKAAGEERSSEITG